jgi:hypothetical protein
LAYPPLGDDAVTLDKSEIVRLLWERGGEFEAPPQLVALVAEDAEALRAALADADPGEHWEGRTLAYLAEAFGKQALLEAARRERP